MRITDMLISGILRKGIIYEARNCEMAFDMPSTQENAQGQTENIKIPVTLKVEHMTLRVEKGRE